MLPTPLGPMLALASDTGLCALEFTGPKKRLTRLERRLRLHFPPHDIVDGETPVIARTREWLAAYFDGTTAEVGDLPIEMHGAQFEKRAPADSARRDAQLWIDREGAALPRRLASRGVGEWRKPDRDCRSVSSRDRIVRLPDRVRGRPRQEVVAARSRTAVARRRALLKRAAYRTSRAWEAGCSLADTSRKRRNVRNAWPRWLTAAF